MKKLIILIISNLLIANVVTNNAAITIDSGVTVTINGSFSNSGSVANEGSLIINGYYDHNAGAGTFSGGGTFALCDQPKELDEGANLISFYALPEVLVAAVGNFAPAKMLVGGLDKAFFGPRLKALMTEIEKALGKSTWFAGDNLTAADIVMGYSMELAAHRAGMDAGNYPNAHRFLQQMRAYPSYQRALEKDGKGTILL